MERMNQRQAQTLQHKLPQRQAQTLQCKLPQRQAQTLQRKLPQRQSQPLRRKLPLRRARTALLPLLLTLLLALMPAALASIEFKTVEEIEPFFRMDRDSQAAWKGEVANLRLLTEGKYRFGKASGKYGIDPDFTPSTRGLDTLDISGSAQFSEGQFHALAQVLRKCAKGKAIYVIDLRSESHAFLNGHPISWYAIHNRANAGMSRREVAADEKARFGALVGTTVKAYGMSHDDRTDSIEIDVRSWQTERKLVKGEGFGYLRIPVLDYSWPTPGQVDAFIDFVKGIDMENTWLHFHCHAGTGRTGIFMMLYDKMKNPTVSMKDIVIRQTLTGSEYPLYSSGSNSFHGVLNAEKARMTPLLFRYVEENCDSNYAVSWSEWLETNDE